MSEKEPSRIRVDWEELLDAFDDASRDHRYYLDRETGAVHFFSSYLDNEEEEEDERSMRSEERYVRIPEEERGVSPEDDVAEFVAVLGNSDEARKIRKLLEASEADGPRQAREAVEKAVRLAGDWRRFRVERTRRRIQRWLKRVDVEPL